MKCHNLQRFHQVLRHGYLSCSLYRYFHEEKEIDICIIVLRKLMMVYGKLGVVDHIIGSVTLLDAMRRVESMLDGDFL